MLMMCHVMWPDIRSADSTFGDMGVGSLTCHLVSHIAKTGLLHPDMHLVPLWP